ncbi:MAG TPA: pseudouridine synthase, partial [Terriglobales bacterium]|nr:pseudouridine synthase [Terriglobales bacterium]
MIEVLFEDEMLIAVNKPANLPVHQVVNRDRSDLQTQVEQQLGKRLVLFHRLDADTTGIVLLGKQRSINAAIAKMFANKRMRKTYWAVVRGRWQPDWNRVE